ncbi:MAG TPA: integration host factor subunit beta [Salinisphaeraceae bacterium]|nr:integration host factor subunit beta [Salinisphaeraceae bacterium]
MTKSELIERLVQSQPHMSQRDVELAAKLLLDRMTGELSQRGRIEIRGFGSFTVHDRPARRGRNPKTGAAVDIPRKFVPHFKPGKELRERVDNVPKS